MAAAVLVLLAFTGCARLDIRHVSDEKKQGLRFYRPWPYLWIAIDAAGNCAARVVYLPDVNEEYRVIPRAGIGSVTFNPKIEDGWKLTGFESTVDSKFNETVSALSGLITAAAGVAGRGAARTAAADLVFKDSTGTEGLGPGLHRFERGDPFPPTFKTVVKVERARCKTFLFDTPAAPAEEQDSGKGAGQGRGPGNAPGKAPKPGPK